MADNDDAAVDYIDGMGESGLAKLAARWVELVADVQNRGKYFFLVYRVPLAASDEDQRSFKGRYYSPPTWAQIRDDHGVGRYEVILVGPPQLPAVAGLKGLARSAAFKLMPWLTAQREVPHGRASAAMFDTVSFGDLKPPVPKPIATAEQPGLFNPKDVQLPKYAAGSDTSFLAAEAIAPHLSQLHALVLKTVLASGTTGMTCDEIEIALDMPHQTASPRINELMKPDPESGRPQLLFDIGARRKTSHGQLATVWIHRDVLAG